MNQSIRALIRDCRAITPFEVAVVIAAVALVVSGVLQLTL